MINKKQQDLLEMYLNEGYEYKDTLDLCDFNLVIVEKEPETPRLQTELQRLHSILTEVTSEKDAFEEQLQETQLELEEVKESLSKVVNELNDKNIAIDNLVKQLIKTTTELAAKNYVCPTEPVDFISYHTTPTIPSSGIYRTSQGSLDMLGFYKIFRTEYNPEIMQYVVPQEAINSLVSGCYIAIDSYINHATVLINQNDAHCIECEVIQRDPLKHAILIKKR